ncbi:MAG TPA: VIT domain-containing protein [Gemmataceae bacterium]|nr:VIT domain-containing protein [Gemmataceae bacterium]
MRRLLPVLAALLCWAGVSQAHGLLIPEEKTVPPLAMLSHKVSIAINDQVAETRVEQVFRNHTDRQLEATYVFPVPKGASVRKFTMWVDGKEVSGELIEADKARSIYTSIVRRTQDPGLLEYLGNNLLQMKVFPIPPKKDQKVAFVYTSVAPKESGLVEYVYPLKTDGKATATLEAFSIKASIKSQHGVQNVYSPTHALTVKRVNDREVALEFERNQGLLDKDFQLFYSTGDKDVGLTAMLHRPVAAENGYFMMLLTPKVEIPKEHQVPRDVVLVLDTSGSMRGVKMEQAKKALKFCLQNLNARDRFALINFSTTVNKYKDGLLAADGDQMGQANQWIDNLEATGGTAINDALAAALELRPAKDEGRTFTVIFFTDGQPTIGETNPEKIIKNVAAKNTANTRIFTFGVGHDVNATMLDTLAEQTRAVATYVRPEEDIGTKVAALHAKISHPVLANLKLTVTNGITLSEVYPPQLPDLFHGQQLTVCGRFTSKGPAAIKLTGQVGKETREFVYELTFPDRTADEKAFVEHIWARRKVGYLLDQIRANGQKPELVEEVKALAKRYGITTPYTSWLIVPDAPMPVARRQPGGPVAAPAPSAPPPGLGGGRGGEKPLPVLEFARQNQAKPGDLAYNRDRLAENELRSTGDGRGADAEAAKEAKAKKDAYDKARGLFLNREHYKTQSGKLGVDLSEQTCNLRNQSRLERTALRQVQGRNCIEVGGVWIDEGFDPKMQAVIVKAQSNAYFRILERHGRVKDVFQLGNYLVWVTPSGAALVIDGQNGKEELSDREIDALFLAKK